MGKATSDRSTVIRHLGGKNRGFGPLTVEVFDQIDRFLLDVGQHILGDRRKLDLGVSIRRRRVTVDRSEVALTIYEWVTEREILHHAHEGVVHRGVSVGVEAGGAIRLLQRKTSLQSTFGAIMIALDHGDP